MEVVHFTQKQLAASWHVSEATLERWRCDGIGPKFVKLPGRVLYRLCDIEAYEDACLSTPTGIANASFGWVFHSIGRYQRVTTFWTLAP